jgi:iron complex transport system ATP-binding protein
MFMQLRRLAHREGKTILLSTHDLELALRLCDRIWMLSPESGLLEGTSADFAENKMLDKHFSSDLLQFSTQQILNYSPLTPQT